MTVEFDLPATAEEVLRRGGMDANVAAREAVLIELYRRGDFTHFQLAQAMGMTRVQTNGLLKKHGVTEDLVGLEEFRREAV